MGSLWFAHALLLGLFCFYKKRCFHEYSVHVFESAQGEMVLGEAEPRAEVEFKAFQPEELFVFLPHANDCDFTINQIKCRCLKLSE